jgi:hypothetical protein
MEHHHKCQQPVLTTLPKIALQNHLDIKALLEDPLNKNETVTEKEVMTEIVIKPTLNMTSIQLVPTVLGNRQKIIGIQEKLETIVMDGFHQEVIEEMIVIEGIIEKIGTGQRCIGKSVIQGGNMTIGSRGKYFNLQKKFELSEIIRKWKI